MDSHSRDRTKDKTTRIWTNLLVGIHFCNGLLYDSLLKIYLLPPQRFLTVP